MIKNRFLSLSYNFLYGGKKILKIWIRFETMQITKMQKNIIFRGSPNFKSERVKMVLVY